MFICIPNALGDEQKWDPVATAAGLSQWSSAVADGQECG